MNGPTSEGRSTLLRVALPLAVCALAWSLGFALWWEARRQRDGLSVRCLTDEDREIAEGKTVQIPFRLRNPSRSRVTLVARRLPCMPAYVESLPETVGPGEEVPFTLVIMTEGMSGPQDFAAVISTDSPQTKLPVRFRAFVHADTLHRSLRLGPIPAGCNQVLRRLTLDDVPADKLSRIGPLSDLKWSLKQVRSRGRELELELCGQTDSLAGGQSEREVVLECPLYFQDADVRCVNLSIVTCVARKWVVPEIVFLTPLSAPEGTTRCVLLRYLGDSSATRGQLRLVNDSSPNLLARLAPARREEGTSPDEESFELTVTLTRRHDCFENVKLRVIGSGEDKDILVPVKASGYGSRLE